MDHKVSEAEIEQLANLARNSGTHYQIRSERRKPRAMRNASLPRRLISRVVSALKI